MSAPSTTASEMIYEGLCFVLLMLGLPAAERPEFDQCRLIDKVLNRLGKAMAINQAVISERVEITAVAAAREALAQYDDSYRRTKRQRAKVNCDGWVRD